MLLILAHEMGAEMMWLMGRGHVRSQAVLGHIFSLCLKNGTALEGDSCVSLGPRREDDTEQIHSNN